ncbi:LacI family DNA-binding transcriptional regulator [Amycolatopsis tolypomycina]|uniref:LacI family DNA-binding transcriptional regulator n=1 Tax=Amycolatopsis tolypomycina TaxID=208445 RepID=UPI001FCA1BDF|nr:LacI family DNA-binding transcriptional regulator [Amycolatopsis tolypomycina]
MTRSGTLGLFAPLRDAVDRAVIMRFISEINAAARLRGYNVLLFTDPDAERDIEHALERGLVDASIVMDVETRESRAESLHSAGHPAVLIGLPERVAGLHCVDMNFFLAGDLAVDYLAKVGHQRIGLVGSPELVYQRGTSYARRLIEGFQRGARARRLQYCWTPCGPSGDRAAQSLDALFRRLPMLSGLVVHNEAALSVLLLELKRRGLRNPQDICVVSVGADYHLTAESAVSASVTIPVREISDVAVETVVAQLSSHLEPEVRLLSPRLVSRDAVSAVSARPR